MDTVMPYVLALVPTIGVATLFYFVIKSILEGDRRERLAQARWEAEHRNAGQGDADQRNAALRNTDDTAGTASRPDSDESAPRPESAQH
jgi:hypothetical protein